MANTLISMGAYLLITVLLAGEMSVSHVLLKRVEEVEKRIRHIEVTQKYERALKALEEYNRRCTENDIPKESGGQSSREDSYQDLRRNEKEEVSKKV